MIGAIAVFSVIQLQLHAPLAIAIRYALLSMEGHLARINWFMTKQLALLFILQPHNLFVILSALNAL